MAYKKKNLFIIEINSIEKAILIQEKSQPIYHLSFKQYIRTLHHHCGHVSIVGVIQNSKLIDGINLRETIGLKKSYFFNFKLKNKNFKTEPDIVINKVTKNMFEYIEQLFNVCIKSKYIWIDNSKK